MKNKYKIFNLCAYIFLVIGYFRWFSLNIFSYSDYNYFFLETLKTSSFSTYWQSNINFGFVNEVVWRLSYQFFPQFLSNFNIPFNISEKILFFILFVFLSIFVSNILSKKFFQTYNYGIFFSLFFLYNPYFLSINSQGHILLSISILFSIISISFYFNKISVNDIIISNIFLFLASIYDVRFTYISFFIILFIFLLEYLINKNKLIYKKIVLFIFLFILINFFWIFLLFLSLFLENNFTLSREIFGTNFYNYLYSVSFFYPFWNLETITWFNINKIPFFYWLLPILAFSPLLFEKKKKQLTLIFSVIALVGIFLTKGINAPFGIIYEFLFYFFPGFSAFRVSDKFYFLILFSYSILIILFINAIKKIKLLKYILFLFIFLLFLPNFYFLYSGNIDSLYVERNIPEDYLLFKNLIISEDEYFRTLWVPVKSRWGYYSDNNPIVSLGEVYNYDWGEFRNSNSIYSPINHQIVELFHHSYSNKLLDISSIKYIVVPIEDEKNNDNFFIYYGNNRSFYINYLNNLSYLKPVDIGFNNLKLYENRNYRPHFYTTNYNESIHFDSNNFNNIKYKKINPTKYEIIIKNLTNPVYLNFAEKYDINWFLSIDNLNFNNYHFKNDANLNSWYLDPNIIGKENVELTLYFKPQSYLYLGLIISLSTLLFLILLLIYDWRLRKEDRWATKIYNYFMRYKIIRWIFKD